MNKQRIRHLANVLERAHPSNFRMDMWLTNRMDVNVSSTRLMLDRMGKYPAREESDCRTVACVAGWAVLLYGRPEHVPLRVNHLQRWAADLLGLDLQTADELFMPSSGNDIRAAVHVPLRELTVSQAVETLRGLAETGEVHWRCECDWEYCGGG